MTNAVAARSGITLAAVKARLGVVGSDDDDLLGELLDAALEAADEFLNNPFTAPDPALGPWADFPLYLVYPSPYPLPPQIELAIPALVKRGVHALIRAWWEVERGSAGMAAIASSVKEGDVSINFLAAADRGMSAIAAQFWAPYRLEPGL